MFRSIHSLLFTSKIDNEIAGFHFSQASICIEIYSASTVIRTRIKTFGEFHTVNYFNFMLEYA